MNWLGQHKVGFILTIAGIGLWIYTGNANFVLLAIAVFIGGIILKAFPRTLVWSALAVYATVATPSGWILVIVLAGLACIFPMLRNITPMGDFKTAKPSH